jgi:D-glycero-alpha-D-manno-heptose-7-phosphate kinase
VSNPDIDAWYATAKAGGALGGKVMGAGGGGFFMFYCPNGNKGRLREALTSQGLRELRFGIDHEGSKVLINF